MKQLFFCAMLAMLVILAGCGGQEKPKPPQDPTDQLIENGQKMAKNVGHRLKKKADSVINHAPAIFDSIEAGVERAAKKANEKMAEWEQSRRQADLDELNKSVEEKDLVIKFNNGKNQDSVFIIGHCQTFPLGDTVKITDPSHNSWYDVPGVNTPASSLPAHPTNGWYKLKKLGAAKGIRVIVTKWKLSDFQ